MRGVDALRVTQSVPTPLIARRGIAPLCLFGRTPEPGLKEDPISKGLRIMKSPTGLGNIKFTVPQPIALGFVVSPLVIVALMAASPIALTPGKQVSPFEFLDPFYPPYVIEQAQLKKAREATKAAEDKAAAEKKAAEEKAAV